MNNLPNSVENKTNKLESSSISEKKNEEIEVQIPFCQFCQKPFSTKGNLNNHIKTIHQGIRLYACTYEGCDKRYSNRSSLDVHIRNHLGQKPFQCDVCLKCFNEKGNLKTHKKFHSANRPFKCNICEKTYKTKGHLKDHIKVQHEKLEKFLCKVCGKDFARFSSLQSHLRSKHRRFEKIKAADARINVIEQNQSSLTNPILNIKPDGLKFDFPINNEFRYKEVIEEPTIENMGTRPNSTFYLTFRYDNDDDNDNYSLDDFQFL